LITGPKLEERSEQPYVAIRTQAAMHELPSVIPQLHGKVRAWLEERGIEPAGPPFIRYLVINMAGKLDIELGFPVKSVPEGADDGRVVAGTLPAGRYASLVYTGPYDGLTEANAALLDWGAERGLSWDSRQGENGDAFGARFERYLSDPGNEPDPQKWVTEVAIRVADSA
jgi:effector-binding domain-containing protein